MKSSIALVARDMGGSQPLGLLAERLRSRGWETNVFLGYGKPIEGLDGLKSAVAQSAVVLCGMSSSPELALPEVEAFKLAKVMEKRVGFFADIFDSHARQWLQAELLGSDIFFVLNDHEAIKAKKHLPNTRVVASGNPLWEQFAFPKFTSEAIRQHLGLREDDSVILVVGTKELMINIALVSAVLNVVCDGEWPCKIIYSFHPGDRNPVAMYEPLVSWSNGRIQLVPSDVMAGSDILPAVDAVVDSFSTIGVQAGFLRKPVVTHATALALNRLEMITGQKIWQPIEQGFVIGTTTEGELYRAIGEAVLRKRNHLLAIQAAMFPVPSEFGQSLDVIVAALEQLVL